MNGAPVEVQAWRWVAQTELVLGSFCRSDSSTFEPPDYVWNSRRNLLLAMAVLLHVLVTTEGCLERSGDQKRFQNGRLAGAIESAFRLDDAGKIAAKTTISFDLITTYHLSNI